MVFRVPDVIFETVVVPIPWRKVYVGAGRIISPKTEPALGV